MPGAKMPSKNTTTTTTTTTTTATTNATATTAVATITNLLQVPEPREWQDRRYQAPKCRSRHTPPPCSRAAPACRRPRGRSTRQREQQATIRLARRSCTVACCRRLGCMTFRRGSVPQTRRARTRRRTGSAAPRATRFGCGAKRAAGQPHRSPVT